MDTRAVVEEIIRIANDPREPAAKRLKAAALLADWMRQAKEPKDGAHA